MIGSIKGILAEKAPPQLLVEAAGIGYELEAPMSTFYELPATGEQVSLLVHMVVREDAQLLYAFGSRRERTLFRALLKVNGVGARVALAILSGMSVEDFHYCVRQKDATALTRIPGIGKKTAERLVVELSDKLPDVGIPAADAVATGTAPVALEQGEESAEVQAQAALVALGYKPADARKMITRVKPEDAHGMTVESLIRGALQQVTQR